jgi:hypothetical protein
MLHEYKAKEIDELKIKKRENRSNQQQYDGLTPVNREDTSHEDEDFPSISVSERAAWLASMAAKGDASTIAPSSEHKDDNLPSSNDTDSTPPPNESATTDAITEPSSEQEAQVVESPVVAEEVEPPRAQDAAPSSELSENLINQTPSEPESKEDTPADNNPEINSADVKDNATEDNATEETTTIVNDSVNEISPNTEVDVTTEKIEKPKVTRLDVLFSFGLVTVQTDPSLEPYMNAVEEVVVKAINNDQNLASKVEYDGGFKPFVKSTVWDCKLSIAILILKIFSTILICTCLYFLIDSSKI